ncbi:hypothetical protein Tco_0503417, partial [Tanacetum coccineum]
FLLYVLEYYQINFSQLSVLAPAIISHFEIMCRVHGSPPTVGVFVKIDHLPSDDVIDLPLLERLNDGRAAIRKYHEVKNRERTLAENESVVGKRKRKVAFNADLPLPVKKVRDSSSAAPSERNPTTAGKTLASLENLGIKSGQ